MPAPARLPAPRDADEASERLRRAPIPAPILEVLHELDRAGYHGVLVGGAVRDVLLGVGGGDWDVASNATPEEAQKLFPRTIPTGIEHGTITVMTGRGKDRHAVELTTFRGEGAYVDGRRPSEVRFLRELVDDLARRDLTINAFAWDPVKEVFTDAFGGLADLQTKVIRAVGDPQVRFAEDGLRTMRAVRFAASMGFNLAPGTEAAIAGALEVFDKVSRERVRVELVKLLAAERPSLGLEPMARTGLWSRVLTELDEGTRGEAIAAVDRLAREPMLRLARLLWPVRARREQVEQVLDNLRPSREERSFVLGLTSASVDALVAAEEPVAIRRAAAALGRELVEPALALLELDGAHVARIREALADAALTSKELAIKGRDLIQAGVAKPGPGLGELLERLFEWVLEDPQRNEAERLLARARELG